MQSNIIFFSEFKPKIFSISSYFVSCYLESIVKNKYYSHFVFEKNPSFKVANSSRLISLFPKIYLP